MQASPERIRFQTETGSVYVLNRDGERMCWHRESVTLGSGPLRSDNGILLRWPSAIELGERCELLSEPINPPWPRLVLTSRIVALLDVPAEGVA
jgi:hypothetical protein